MEPTPTPEPQRQPPPPVAESPFMSIISALLFLYIGFWLRPVGMTGEQPYDGSVTAFVWMARIVGIGLLVVAALTYARQPFVYPLNFIMALLATIGCLATGVIWIAYGDRDGYLIVIFGLLNGSATRTAWRIWQRR